MKPVIALHGGGLGAWSWRGVVKELPEWQILTPTLQGHDEREGSFDMASSVQEIGAMIKDQGGSAHLVGLSLGGQLALAVASAYPQLVESLLVTGANVNGIPYFRSTTSMIKAFAPLRNWKSLQAMTMRSMGVNEENDRVAYSRSAATMDATRLTALLAASNAFRLPEGLAALAAPTAVLRGAREADVVKRSVEQVVEVVPGAVSGVAHDAAHPWPLQQPQRFAGVLRYWLETQHLPQPL